MNYLEIDCEREKIINIQSHYKDIIYLIFIN